MPVKFNQTMVYGSGRMNRKPNINEFDNLPVRTASLSPGEVTKRPIENGANILQPVFIVGYDEFSMSWLGQYKDQLRQLNAVGLAVNVDDENQMRRLIEAAGGLKIQAVPGQRLAELFNLQHYPVLISRTHIEQ
ncbi:MAG: integrating conjugative element protein [Gammaproteobacteria bacterium]